MIEYQLSQQSDSGAESRDSSPDQHSSKDVKPIGALQNSPIDCSRPLDRSRIELLESLKSELTATLFSQKSGNVSAERQDVFSANEEKIRIQSIIDDNRAAIVICCNGSPIYANNELSSLFGGLARPKIFSSQHLRTLLSRHLADRQSYFRHLNAEHHTVEFRQLCDLTIPGTLEPPCAVFSFGPETRSDSTVCLVIWRVDQESRKHRLQTLKALTSQLHGMVFISDSGDQLDGIPRIRHVNRGYLDALGYTELEILGQPFDFLFQRIASNSEITSRREFSMRQAFSMEGAFETKAGERRWCKLDMSPLFDMAGFFDGWMGITRDITAEKRHLELKQATNEILERISAGAPMKETLEAIALACDSLSLSRRCGIILLDEDGVHMRHASAPGLPQFFVQAVDGAEIGRGRGPCDIALATRSLVKIDDVKNSELSDRFKVLAEQANIQSVVSNPIFSATGDVLGSLAIYDDSMIQLLPFDLDIIYRFTNLARLSIEQHLRVRTLKDVQEKFELLTNAVAEVLWIWDCELCKTVFVSSAYETVWGRSRAALLNGTDVLHDSIHPDDLLLMDDWKQEARDHKSSDGIRLHASYRIVRPDGTIRWIRETNYPNRNSSGDLNTIVSVSRDITAEIEIRAQLEAESERRRLEGIVSPDAAWDLECSSDRIWWSSGIGRILELDVPEGFMDRTFWWNRVHSADRQALQQSFLEVLGSRAVDWEAKYRVVKDNGSIIWIVDRAHISRDEFGNAKRATGSCSDVTEHHNVEEQLRQSQRLEVIGQLTGGIAHDFNNLLTVVIGNTELLVAELRDNEKLLPLAEMSLAASLRGAAMTDRLLTFSRKQALAPKSVDVGLLLKGMSLLIRSAIGERTQLKYEVGDSVWHAMADSGQLENAILNLCINARDALPQGGLVRVVVEETRVGQIDHWIDDAVAPGDYVSISVIDDGIGMSEHALHHAFEPFFTTKEIGKGSGLGLSMVYGFAKQSQGHAFITSVLGKGTCVKLLLPRAEEEPTTVGVFRRHIEMELGEETILLVEDDAIVRNFVCEQLGSLGYKILVSVNGSDALRIVESDQRIDLVFSDCVLPGQYNGGELAREILKARPELPVLLTSGYIDGAVDLRKLEAVGVHFLKKPYRRHELAGEIRRSLERRIVYN
jgi:PAS domain S-box-containing protein